MTKVWSGVVICLAVIVAGPVRTDVVSPMNGRIVPCPETSESYFFWVIGHLYGAAESHSAYPSGAFLANIDMLNESGALMLVTLGDIVRIPDEQHLANLRKVAHSVTLPMFNAPGNHELQSFLQIFSREQYTDDFGPPYQDFTIANALFVFLDTNLTPGEIAGEQLEYFTRVMRSAAKDRNIRNIFVFSHHVIWCTDDPRLAIVWRRFVNYRPNYRPGKFEALIEPLLAETAAQKPVFWLSGDVGGSAGSFSPFYWKAPDKDITYVATGVGGTDRDEIIKVEVQSSGEVVLTPVSLVGKPMGPMEQYSVAHWEGHVGEGRGIMDRVVRVLGGRSFWLGAICSSILTVLIMRFWACRKRRCRAA